MSTIHIVWRRQVFSYDVPLLSLFVHLSSYVCSSVDTINYWYKSAPKKWQLNFITHHKETFRSHLLGKCCKKGKNKRYKLLFKKIVDIASRTYIVLGNNSMIMFCHIFILWQILLCMHAFSKNCKYKYFQKV